MPWIVLIVQDTLQTEFAQWIERIGAVGRRAALYSSYKEPPTTSGSDKQQQRRDDVFGQQRGQRQQYNNLRTTGAGPDGSLGQR